MPLRADENGNGVVGAYNRKGVGKNLEAWELKLQPDHLQPAGAEGYTAGGSVAGSRTL